MTHGNGADDGNMNNDDKDNDSNVNCSTAENGDGDAAPVIPSGIDEQMIGEGSGDDNAICE